MIAYVGRYTHRAAITNSRILNIADGKVTFRYKDYRDEKRIKTMTLPAEEFIRRFLLHVLPEGFVRIRHFGLMANGRKKAKLERCREVLGEGIGEKEKEERENQEEREREKEEERCRECGKGIMRRRMEFQAGAEPEMKARLKRVA